MVTKILAGFDLMNEHDLNHVKQTILSYREQAKSYKQQGYSRLAGYAEQNAIAIETELVNNGIAITHSILTGKSRRGRKPSSPNKIPSLIKHKGSTFTLSKVSSVLKSITKHKYANGDSIPKDSFLVKKGKKVVPILSHIEPTLLAGEWKTKKQLGYKKQTVYLIVDEKYVYSSCSKIKI